LLFFPPPVFLFENLRLRPYQDFVLKMGTLYFSVLLIFSFCPTGGFSLDNPEAPFFEGPIAFSIKGTFLLALLAMPVPFYPFFPVSNAILLSPLFPSLFPLQY